MKQVLPVGGVFPLEALSAGMVISRGIGRHIDRVIEHFVLLFVRTGVLYIEEDGVEFEVEAGQSLLLWPNRRHLGTRDYDEKLQFFWLHFNLVTLPVQDPTLEVQQHKQLTRPDIVTELFRRYMDDDNSGHLQPVGAALYTWMILQEVSDSRPPSDYGAATVLAANAYAFIQTHFHEKISAADVAQAVGYNAQYLGRIYQRTYRRSLADAIRRARIGHAKSLLLHTNSNIGEIARQSGFEDVTYFQRVFKQLEGITPLRFRKLHARRSVSGV